MITNEIKKQIVEALEKGRENFTGSQAKYAVSIGINKAIYSRILKGYYENVLSEPKWISLARRAGISLNADREWKKADTPVFGYITTQLEKCQQDSNCSLLCDMSDIGKTFSARHYAKSHKNAVYVDCSQVKTKSKFIRQIAREFGVDHKGSYDNVYEDLVFYLKTLDRPLIILDEAGDLDYKAFLEIKALYNAIEYQCGIYMMGADGLKAKMEHRINGKVVGYTEIFSRFNKKYNTALDRDSDKREKEMAVTAAMIIKANAPAGTNIKEVINRSMSDGNMPSLRRIYTELSKLEA